MAEALQLLPPSDTEYLFSSPLLALDVGAAPGGWTRVLSRVHSHVSVLAIDPGKLCPSVEELPNISHVASKAETLSDNNGEMLDREASKLVGDDWREQYRLLVCDANLDIRDTLRELVLPLASFLQQGGIMVVTLKLGRRVGVEGVERKVTSAREMLEMMGFSQEHFRVVWLFGNSKNERTIFAKKIS